MNIFVTGATGWVGSAVVADLIAAGHHVTGLTRTGEKAAALESSGAHAVRGTLDDVDVLQRAASQADAVVHTAFDHDFSRYAENAAQDGRAIEALGSALAGSDRMLLVTSGMGGLTPDRPTIETDVPSAGFPRLSESAGDTVAARGVRVARIRLAPSVHGIGDHGFVPILIDIARKAGVSAYVGDGANRWAGVHRSDAARLYRLVLEEGARHPAYHAAADEGVPFRDIAATIGKGLGLPVEARPAEHFGWFGRFAAANMSASSALTREWTGWNPTGPTLLEDLARPEYFAG